METVIYEDSPLAEFLQGTDDTDEKWPATTKRDSTTSIGSDSFSFAPRGLPKPSSRNRRRPDSQVVFAESLASRIRRKCLDTFAWRIGQSEQIKALEQLRFTIIGSQLLNDRSTSGGLTRPQSTGSQGLLAEAPIGYTISGLFYTAGAAFACALSLWWATKTANLRKKRTRLAIVSTVIATIVLTIYGFCLRQYRNYARKYTVRTATAMVGNAQAFDSAAYAASNFISEVELTSRGYRLGNPMPPVSRIDDSSTQTRRCRRLRHALRSALDELVVPHIEAYNSLHLCANPINLERYFDMYEISRSDVEEILDSVEYIAVDDDPESLRALKVDLHRLFISRKIFLCSILALDADRTASNLDWGFITELMEEISNRTALAATTLDDILGEEQNFNMPPSPRSPHTPNRDKVRHHLRRFANLSQGLRGLQAKMQILREESDRSLGSSEEVTELGNYLLEQYDAVGSDMKSLLADWEEGRAALTANIGKNERRISSSFMTTPNRLSRCSSPSNSLGGITAVGGSPSDALRILNGETLPIVPTTGDADTLEEEVFESLASPRNSRISSGSIASREERIAKMRDERTKLAAIRERADASRHMVRELETVIKARPHRRKTSSPMAPLPVRITSNSSPPPQPSLPLATSAGNVAAAAIDDSLKSTQDSAITSPVSNAISTAIPLAKESSTPTDPSVFPPPSTTSQPDNSQQHSTDSWPIETTS